MKSCLCFVIFQDHEMHLAAYANPLTTVTMLKGVDK